MVAVDSDDCWLLPYLATYRARQTDMPETDDEESAGFGARAAEGQPGGRAGEQARWQQREGTEEGGEGGKGGAPHRITCEEQEGSDGIDNFLTRTIYSTLEVYTCDTLYDPRLSVAIAMSQDKRMDILLTAYKGIIIYKNTRRRYHYVCPWYEPVRTVAAPRPEINNTFLPFRPCP